jgi:hypothetical protein
MAFFRNKYTTGYSKNSTTFTEPEGSILCSQGTVDTLAMQPIAEIPLQRKQLIVWLFKAFC